MFCFFKQKTAYEMRISDWSSDVCSSDLRCTELPVLCAGKLRVVHAMGYARLHLLCEENEVMDATQQLVDSENAGAAPVPFRVAATTASWIPRSPSLSAPASDAHCRSFATVPSLLSRIPLLVTPGSDRSARQA